MTDDPVWMALELSSGHASGLFTPEAVALMVMRRTGKPMRRDWVRDNMLGGDEDRAIAFAHRMDGMVGGGLTLGDDGGWGMFPSGSWTLTEEGERAADMLWELYVYLERVEPRAVLS